MSVTVSPVQWAELENIDDIEPLNDSDTQCLAELRDVLARHGRLNRFGVALLHSHFDLQANEILLESVNTQDRLLITSIVTQSEAPTNHVGTIWALQEGITPVAYCKAYCKRPEYWQMSHSPAHKKSKIED